MKILITGSSGFLGNHIYKYLSKYNSVYTLSRFKSDYCVDLSLSVPEFSENFELIIHAAGKAHLEPKNIDDIRLFNKINKLGTSNLLQGFENSMFLPKYFVFISSVRVYGISKGEYINEKFPLLANDAYGRSKIEAEHIVKQWCDTNNVICTILRLPLIVGINPPGNLGSMINGIKNGYYFNIAGGNAKKSMVLASDISKFILKAAKIGGTYNLTDGIHPTFNELSKTISFQIGKSFVPNVPLFIAKILAKIGDLVGDTSPINSTKLCKIISTLTFDDSKARIAFGWNPTPVLDGFKLHEDAK